ncbi:hypothetical protein PG2029B_1222 [Bifidobacterium pseudolongum subsp. globosum]|uniref:Nucleotide exchange factor GrpE n=2 Tax=Bifidobacterium pseudolongum TaxID=1694 RepID=A0A4Q5AGA3_9BIFI|nr:hypothetical protein PG2032B_1221 [Bifidobacterium pseudolongum subsp. globosum]RYQ28617.1 hypothetical protein PG2029B_1222 [Bifidobacterium pseudolongum subsp. globosum]
MQVPVESSLDNMPTADSAVEVPPQVQAPENAGSADAEGDASAPAVTRIANESRDEIAEAARDIKRASRKAYEAAESVINFETRLTREVNKGIVERTVAVYRNLFDVYHQLVDYCERRNHGVSEIRDGDEDGRHLRNAQKAMEVACIKLAELLQSCGAERLEAEPGSPYNDHTQNLNPSTSSADVHIVTVQSVRPGFSYLGEVILREWVQEDESPEPDAQPSVD